MATSFFISENDLASAAVFMAQDSECKAVTGNAFALSMLQIKKSKMFSLNDEECCENSRHFRFFRDNKELRLKDHPMRISAQKGIVVNAAEFSVVFDDGKAISLIGSASPLYDEEGIVTGAIGVFIDISAKKALEQERKKNLADLEELVQQRTAELTHTVSALEMEVRERLEAEEKLREINEMLKVMSRNTLEILENDRKVVAKELHDSIGANLSSIKLFLEQFIHNNEVVKRGEEASLIAIVDYLKATIKETKRISAYLRPSVLDDYGIIAAVDSFIKDYAVLHPNLKIDFLCNVNERDIPETLKIVIFRILQEAVTNIVKHSCAKHVMIHVSKTERKINLEIQDDGIGFSVKEALSPIDPLTGFGLTSMRERAEICDGCFHIDSIPGKGTKLIVILPLVTTYAS